MTLIVNSTVYKARVYADDIKAHLGFGPPPFFLRETFFIRKQPSLLVDIIQFGFIIHTFR